MKEEQIKDERKTFYDFLDTMLDEVEEKKEGLRKEKKKLMHYGKFVAFRLPQSLFESVEKVAEKIGKTSSEVLREAVQEFLSKSTDLLKEYKKVSKEAEERELEPVKEKEEYKETLKQFLAEHEEEIKEYFKNKESSKSIENEPINPGK